jgi:hypothetical protein
MMKKVFGVFVRTEKSIFIDPNLPQPKKSFLTQHETGHGVIPWQKHVVYLDDESTLSPEVKKKIEAVANYFASGDLFQLDRYNDAILKLPLEIGSPKALAKKFGGSNHASFRK